LLPRLQRYVSCSILFVNNDCGDGTLFIDVFLRGSW
jgi:hypothetical protein